MKSIKRLLSVLLSIALILSSLCFAPISSEARSSYERAVSLDSVSASEWMRAIRGETKLTEITIPGTHDSCTLQMANSIVAGIAQCQSLTIDQQLDAGVRFLDVRCEVEPNSHSCWAVHGTADCYKGSERYFLDYIFQDIYSWLAKHPSETVLVSIKEDDGDVGAPTFTSSVYEYIHGYGQGKYFYGSSYNYKDWWYLGKSVPTLDSVRGKCVLMNRFDQVIYSSGSTADENESGQKIKWGYYGGTEWKEPVYETIYNASSGVGAVYVQDHFEWSTANKLKATQMMLDLKHDAGHYYFNFTSTTIGTAIPNPGYHSQEINPYYSSLNFTRNKPSGVMVMDFITSDLARVTIKNNEAVSCLSTGTDGTIQYTLNRLTGELEIRGVGDMNDYSATSSVGSTGIGTSAPWGDQPRGSLFDGQYNTDLVKKITIYDGITSIGANAFYGFDNVENVVIANSVKSIGDNAFRNCASIKTINISKSSISSIGTYAFADCTSLQSFYTSSKVSSIGANAFSNCSALTMYGLSGTYSESYAINNSITFVSSGAYDSDIDWFTSKATYYQQFAGDIGGNAVSNIGTISWLDTYNIGGKTLKGVAHLPYGISKSATNYIATNQVPVGYNADGVTISFYRAIGTDNNDGVALTLAQDSSHYLAITDTCKFEYKGNSSLSYYSAAKDSVNKKWQYITLSINSSTIKMYIDGRLQYQTNSNSDILSFITNSNTKIYLGSYIARGTCDLYLDEVCIIPTSIDDDEALAMYKSYEKPILLTEDVQAPDANISITASNGYENVIYTHGRNPLSTTPLNQAADYMFIGDEIADGNNDNAYIYSTTSAGTENELYTTFKINGTYQVRGVTDSYGNTINYELVSTDGYTNTYKLRGTLYNSYIDGSDDDIALIFSIRKSVNGSYKNYQNTKYVHVTTHPVSAGAASAIYKTANNSNRDAGVYLKAIGSTGYATGESASNYVYAHTPAYIGNGWCFVDHNNAENYLCIGDGKRGDNSTSSSLNNTGGAGITAAGVFAHALTVGNINAQSIVASGTTANYYIDKSMVKSNSTIGGVTFGTNNSYTIDTFVTRLSPNYKESDYYWASSNGYSSSYLSWETANFNKDNAQKIGTSGVNDTSNAQQFGYISPKVKGNLSYGTQSIQLRAALQASSTAVYAESQVDVRVNVYDKSKLRSLVNSCESASVTGKNVSKDTWEKYQSCLEEAYANLNNYKITDTLDENSSVYKSLVDVFKEINTDRTRYNLAVEKANNALNEVSIIYTTDSLNSVLNELGATALDQSTIDISTGKIIFALRFLDTINSARLVELLNTVSTISNDKLYDIPQINAYINRLYSDISLSSNGKRFYAFYSQSSFDELIDYYDDLISNSYRYYSITCNKGYVDYYVDGAEISDVSKIKYGESITAKYNGKGSIVKWFVDDEAVLFENEVSFDVLNNVSLDYSAVENDELDISAFSSAVKIALEIPRLYDDITEDSLNNLNNVVMFSMGSIEYVENQAEVDRLTADVQTAINSLVHTKNRVSCYYCVDYSNPALLFEGYYEIDDVVNLDASSIGYEATKWVYEDENGCDAILQRGSSICQYRVTGDVTIYCHLDSNYQNNNKMYLVSLVDKNNKVVDAYYIEEGTYSVSINGNALVIGDYSFNARTYPFYDFTAFSVNNEQIVIDKDIVISSIYTAK